MIDPERTIAAQATAAGQGAIAVIRMSGPKMCIRDRLNSECPPNIHWLGELSRMQLRQQMETAWCLLLRCV